ncbi:hypothetical protein GCM10010345_26020 [Streptomyces canarius]|uniref:Uncharacterized protein n=1 Tax=Streptomyces canarius TaxID=285453 RepID=A0ABQ3CNH8_9ACTN|nr:hypothetical protein GCM10010345_26020 [Streptomyces canarius]
MLTGAAPAYGGNGEVASRRMVSSFAFFGPPAITLLLFAVGTVPYALWVTRRKPSRPARWAVIGAAAAIAGYGAATGYGLASRTRSTCAGTGAATACTGMPDGSTA